MQVPDVVGEKASEAIGILAGDSLSYDMDEDAAAESDFIVTKQYLRRGRKSRRAARCICTNVSRWIWIRYR